MREIPETHEDTSDGHCSYIDRFTVSCEELGGTRRSLLMLRVAYEEGEAETLAAILSCACSCEVIARTIGERNPSAVNNPIYGAWIKGDTTESYCGANALLIDMLDSPTESCTEAQLQHLEDIF